MTRQRILVTGKNGQIGYALQLSLRPLGGVVAVDVEDCDLTDTAAIASLVEKVKPDLIVNSADYTAIEEAEFDAEVAFAMNATAPKVLAAQANLLNIPIIHYSTNYVFDGCKEGWYVEDDKVNPQSICAKTKWQGEKNVRAMCAQHVILRTCWVYGEHDSNFFKTTLRLAKEKDSFNTIAGQLGSPTSARLLADSTAVIAQELLGGEVGKFGTYHLTSAGETTWHGYARKVIETAKALGVSSKVAPMTISTIPIEAYLLEGFQSQNSRLSTAKIQKAFNLNIPDWEEEVESVLKNVIRSAPERI